ncbi:MULTISPECIES: salicylate synthase [unclassified Streptomyces]|uniref:salicylate synthase n=1 Tax=unclassified Streptomyces TaxID=2593676 RepID=UPI002365964E|nr:MULTISPECIES: salicylate synthase [unclassified Streptomyces]MDF3144451.1 salicylate synthase [Streptomyces sp. T21Q-yed]WDF35898.1 salicylate synthase [Streptomyces sp. T12]
MLRYRSAETELPGDPVRLAAQLVESDLFDQYVIYEQNGDLWFAGGALGEIQVDRSEIRRRWLAEETTAPLGPHPLRQVHGELDRMAVADWNAYGWMAFEFSHLYAGRPDRAGEGDLLHLLVPHSEVRLSRKGALIRSADQETLEALTGLLGRADAHRPAVPRPIDVSDTEGGYLGMVARAIEEIRTSDLQKVILSRSVDVPFPVDFVATYLHGRAHNTPARSFLLDFGGRRVAGFSPETVAEVGADGEVVTQPLAGTRAHGFGEQEDERLRAELLADPKEISEHVLSVKLAEEEMATVCRPGTVSVRDLLSVRRRGSVQHLGSSVHGLLAESATAWDALRAVFPAVTASGIPKASAYDCIARLEKEPRGIYSGAVLRAGSDGSLDAALVLRSLFEQGGRTWLRAGAGILAGSTPARELEETCEKLRSVAPYVVPAQGQGRA